jgi:hypothetical protein
LYNYFTYDQNLRLIFREFDRDNNSKQVIEKKSRPASVGV